MTWIDLRSDTVTHPTPAMREAMFKAPVGDDVMGEDPTVNELQERAAALLGKEAALFVTSGTMGNLAAVLSHCGRGDEVILGDKSHTFLFEAGGISALGSVHSRQVVNQPDGTLKLDDIEAAIRPPEIHNPITRLVALENTHNRCGGAVLDAEYCLAVGELVKKRAIACHLDGARIFNAAVMLGVPARRLAEAFDSVTFCLSKGLCAPVGSVLCGSREFIQRARRIRKQLGGGMRQAGILAAAGLVAIDQMIDRLAEDHARASLLAQRLQVLPGLILDADCSRSNMIFCDLAAEVKADAATVAGELKQMGVGVGVVAARRFRLVLHHDIHDQDLEPAVDAFITVLQQFS